MEYIIMHLDMDAFFASIEERENPALRGRPIVVGADPKSGSGRGVVSTASYAARKFGIHSAMPISRAWELCPAPACAYLPVDMKLYGIVSERIMGVVRDVVELPPPLTPPRAGGEIESVSPSRQGGEKIISSPFEGEVRRGLLMEQVSVDEAYVDVSFCKSYDRARVLAQKIKDAIKKQERLTCSVGIGPNKLIAKIASDFQKPDGLTVVRPEGVQNFLDPMPVRKLPGVGPKAEAAMRRQGIETILDLRLSLPESDELFERVHGLDDSPVVTEHEVKSLGHEITFEHDSNDQALLTKTIIELCDEVMDEAFREGISYKTVTVRVRFDNFETHTSSHTLRSHTQDGTLLKQNALKLLFPYFGKKRLVRLIGVRVSNLKGRDD